MTKRKPGQPTKYRPEYCDLLIEHMKEGLSFETFAAVVGTHFDTLYEWVKVHPEFSEAKKVGLALGQLFWEQIGRDHLRQEFRGDTINSTVWIFNMKNRFGWRDKKDVEHKVDQKTEKLVIHFSKKNKDGSNDNDPSSEGSGL